MNQYATTGYLANCLKRPGFDVARRYLVFVGAANLLWESAHLPLYTLWREGDFGDLVLRSSTARAAIF